MATPTRANFGPLTTIFTAPSYCNNPLLQTHIDPINNHGYLSKWCSDHQGQLDNYLACWPHISATSVSLPFDSLGVYSPGMLCSTTSEGLTTWLPACPLGYETACGTTSGGDGDFNFQLPVLMSETAVGCCPSMYTCVSTTVSPQSHPLYTFPSKLRAGHDEVRYIDAR